MCLLKKTMVLLFALFTLLVSAQGELEKSKKELGKNKSKTSTSESSGSSIDGNPFFAALLIEIAGNVVIGNYRNEAHLWNDLSPYPYYNLRSGNYTREDTLPQSSEYSYSPRMSRLDISNHILAGNSIYGNHLKLNYRPLSLLSIEAGVLVLLEPNVGESMFTTLTLIDLNACYDRIRMERFNLGWFIGLNYTASGINTIGFNYGLNTEIFLPDRFSLFATARGTLINGHNLNQYEGMLRYSITRHYVSVGYRLIHVASNDLHFGTFGVGVYL